MYMYMYMHTYMSMPEPNELVIVYSSVTRTPSVPQGIRGSAPMESHGCVVTQEFLGSNGSLSYIIKIAIKDDPNMIPN